MNNAVADGKERRKAVSRSDLGKWRPRQRKHTPAEIMEAASHGRLPDLLKLKRDRMCASPFGFFRGDAAVMAYDLSLSANTGIFTQICGDAHVQNLGAYAGIDGKLIFDINDFDETVAGPFEWDVKRMATSILLAGQQAAMKAEAFDAATTAFLNAYAALVRNLAKLPVLDTARYQVRRLSASAPIAGILGRAERASPLHLREKLTKETPEGRSFRAISPILWRVEGSERRAVLGSIARYRESLLPERRHFLDQFRPVDVGFKVVGTGSVGLRDYCVYMLGNGEDDPLFLQIKQEARSVYAPYLPRHHDAHMEQGQRVAEGQRAMQLQSDPMLGWTRCGGRDYVVRQLNDHKATLDVTTLSPANLVEYSKVCGEILARGHSRSGYPCLIAGYIGRGEAFTAAMLNFASSYAEQTVRDWKLMRNPSN